MYTAFEAYKMTFQVNDTKLNNELKKIFLDIDKAISKGLYHVSGTGCVSQLASYQLRKLGYSVSNDIFEGDEFYFISWNVCDLNENNILANKNMQNNTTNNGNNNSRNKTNKRKFPVFFR